MSSVPSTVLTTFFDLSTKALNEYQLVRQVQDPPRSLSEFRQQLLQIQKHCLDQVSLEAALSVEDIQQALRNKLPPDVSDHDMNEAARLAFCRLALQQESALCQGSDDRHLIRSGKIERSALLEFLGLCNISIKLPNVLTHLSNGAPLFGCEGPSIPSQRMERIQKLFMTAVGYDPDFGTEEIKRIFFTTATSNEFTGDKEVEDLFAALLNNMHAVITNASMQEATFSDKDDGGVTRVLSVTYTERMVSPDEIYEGQSIGAPRKQEAIARGGLSQDLMMARDAAVIQQSILGQLMTMSEREREEVLQKAKEANDNFMQRALALPAGPDRIAFMQSIDSNTQQQLLQYKIWTGMLQAHGGQAPTMYNQN